MKPYLLSLVIGLLVGAIYSLFGVRSPAPPVIALVGLLGILAGEQLPPLMQHLFKAETRSTSWLRQQVKPHMFGELPQCAKAPAPVVADRATGAPRKESPRNV